jgi:hypothetical protein
MWYVDHMTTISLFRSATEPDVFGFTNDPAGANLPSELGPWNKAGSAATAQIRAACSVEGLASSDPVIEGVEREGFYLAASCSNRHHDNVAVASWLFYYPVLE